MPQSLDVADFSGGITDNIADAPSSAAEKMDNFVLTNENKLKSRPGTEPYIGTEIPDALIGQGRKLESFDDGSALLTVGQNECFVYEEGPTWHTVAPVTQPAIRSTGRITCAQSQKHFYITNDSLEQPVQKVYKKPDGTYALRTAGLQKPPGEPSFGVQGTLFNLNRYLYGLASKIVEHAKDVVIHKATINPTNPIRLYTTEPIFADIKDDFVNCVSLYFQHIQELLLGVTDRFGVISGTQKTSLSGQFHKFSSGIAKIIPSSVIYNSNGTFSFKYPETVKEAWEMSYELARVFDSHDMDGNAHTTGGLHTSASSNEVINASPSQYVYAFVRFIEYQTSTATFQDYSATRLVQVYGYDEIPSDTSKTNYPAYLNIISIPAITESTYENYAPSLVKTKIYRTTNNGTVLRYVGEVSSSQMNFVDRTKDSTLINNEAIYTTGGVLDNDAPPKAKYLHAVSGVMLYANVRYDANYYPNRILQSVPGDPDSVPEASYIDLPAELTGVSSVKNTPLAFTKRGVYRIDGSFDELGRGTVSYQAIDAQIDAIAGSIVQLPDSVVWWSSDGAFISDGFTSQKLTRHLDDRFAGWVSTAIKRNSIFGTHDTFTKRVIWGLKSTDSSPKPDLFVVLDMQNKQLTFYTWSGFVASDMATYNMKLVSLNSNSHLMVHDESLVFDATTVFDSYPDVAYRTPVIPDYISVAHNLTVGRIKSWVSKLKLRLQGDNASSIAISGCNNNSGTFHDLNPIALSGAKGVVVETRRFPAGALRTNSKQVRITYGEKVIFSEGRVTAMAPNLLVWQTPVPTLPSNLAGNFAILSFGETAKKRRIIAQGAGFIRVDSLSDVIGQQGFITIRGAIPVKPLMIHDYSIEFEPFSTANPQSKKS